ncbi:MAG: ROK family protein [Actinobacteria bacterium]|nr:ROK family protein [Actinomycetota bacterium]
MAPRTHAFGVDIGGSGIKGAVVDTATGRLLTERRRVDTPSLSTPKAVAKVVAQLVHEAGWDGVAGVAFPAVIKRGVALTAANVDKSWIGTDADATFSVATGLDVTVLNDADAAGLAEVRYGAAREASGVVILLTFGTGIGSALFLDGRLVSNSELGHLEIDGLDAETRAAASAKEREGLSWREWAKRVQRYLRHVEDLFAPDLFVVGGGVSKKSERWVPLLELRTPVKPAELENDAGIAGAGLAAIERSAGAPADAPAG